MTSKSPALEERRAHAAETDASVTQLARGGTLWTLFGYGGAQILRFGANVALSYVLLKEHFGLMQLVNAFIIGLEMFSDLGVWRSVIQNPRGADAPRGFFW